MKRRYIEAFTDPETQSQIIDMPSNAASGSRTKFGGKWRRKYSTRRSRMARSFPKSNSCIISRTVDHDIAFDGNYGYGFGFSPTHLWINQVSTTAISGASEIAALFDLVRIVKVEVTVLPGQNFMGYGSNTSGTGVRNIPIMYHCYDPNDGLNPTLSSSQENNTCKVDILDKIIKRTIYPQMTVGNQLMTDIGSSRKDVFVKSSYDSPWYAFKAFFDLDELLAYDAARISFKIFYECRNSI